MRRTLARLLGKHVHEWKLDDFVLDTYPPIYTCYCECGAVQQQGGPLDLPWHDVRRRGGEQREAPPR